MFLSLLFPFSIYIERETDTEVALKINSRVERKVHREENHLLAKREKKLKALGVQQTRSSLSNTALESKKKRNRRFRRQKGKKKTEKHKDDQNKDILCLLFSYVFIVSYLGISTSSTQHL